MIMKTSHLRLRLFKEQSSTLPGGFKQKTVLRTLSALENTRVSKQTDFDALSVTLSEKNRHQAMFSNQIIHFIQQQSGIEGAHRQGGNITVDNGGRQKCQINQR